MLSVVFIGAGAVIAIVLMVSAIMEKDYTVSAEIIIEKPKDEVFVFVRNLKNLEKYSSWVLTDPDVKMTYTGTDGTVGFTASWESLQKNVGVGEQEILKIDEVGRIDIELRFKKPFEGISHGYTLVESVSATQTRVTNAFISREGIPKNLMVPLMKKMIKKSYYKDLQSLKRVLEQK